MKITYLPKHSELTACVDETGVVNLSKLTGLIIYHLCCIDTFGQGKRKHRSAGALGRMVRAFLVKHGFTPEQAVVAWENAADLVKLELNAQP